MTRRRNVMLWIFIPLYLCLGLFAAVFILQVPWHLAFGWISFLKTNVPQIKVSGSSLISVAVLFTLLILGLQLFLSRVATTTSLQHWRWRWTLSTLGMVILMFAAGIATVGMVHQVGWMLTGPDRILKNDFYASIPSRSNLKAMGMAFHQAINSDEQLPQGALFDENGRALHSWGTLLLPHLMTDLRHADILIDVDLAKPWTDPANVSAFRTKLPVFLNPSLGPDRIDGRGANHYAWNSHLLGIPTPLKTADIKDGRSNTLLIGEVNTGHRAWGDPVNWRDPALGLDARPDTFGGSSGGRSVFFLLLDGSSRSLSTDIAPEVLKALATPAGGEPLSDF